MSNTHLLVIIAAALIAHSASGQKSKKCYKLLESKQYAQSEDCFRHCIDSAGAEALYGLSESLIMLRKDPANLDSAFASSRRAARAFASLSAKEQQKLQASRGLSESAFAKQQNKASFYAYKFVSDTSLQQLTRFATRFSGTSEAKLAQDKIEEFVVLLNLPENKSAEFYRGIIDRFPQNPQIELAWQQYYRAYTFDGELLTIEKFALNFPQYPFPDEIERDRSTAQIAERYRLDQVYTASLSNMYRRYIEQAAPRHRAMKVLRMYISPMVSAKEFARAADTVRSFSGIFGASPSFAGLLSVLTEQSAVPLKKPLAGMVNSAGSEFSPVLTENDRVMYLCGKDRAGKIGGEDIYVSQLENGSWSAPVPIPGVNTVLGNEAPEALSSDGTRMLLFQNGDIYYSDKYLNAQKQLRWSDPVRFPTVNTPGWDGDATLTADGNAMLFASESGQRPNMQFISRERKDRFDIYVSVRDGDKWGEPINLGLSVNTHYCDRYPYLHPDMQTLYFSSEGHSSLGGLDVFVCKRLNPDSWTEWSEPVSLGKYINTPQDDTGYKISNDGTLAYFAAYGAAKFDIYTVEIPENRRPQKLAAISGLVLSADSSGISAQISVEDLATGSLVGQWRSDVQDGSFTVLLPLGRSYGYFVSQAGYYPASAHIDLSAADSMVEIQQQFVLQKVDSLVKYRSAVELPNIFFATDKYELQPSSYPELKRIAGVLIDNKVASIQIEGHTDAVGTDEYNLQLSQLRAQAVADYLSQLMPGQLSATARGFGSQKPAASNGSSVGRAENRRVELRFGR